MEEIKKEFEQYLKTIVESYPKSAEKILHNPSLLSEIGAKSKDFNSKAQAKIKELASANKLPEINLIVELTPIVIQYHSQVMNGHL